MANPGLFRGAILEAPLIYLDGQILNPFYRYMLQNVCQVWPQLPVYPLETTDMCAYQPGQRKIFEDPLRVKGNVKLRTVLTLVDAVRVS